MGSMASRQVIRLRPPHRKIVLPPDRDPSGQGAIVFEEGVIKKPKKERLMRVDNINRVLDFKCKRTVNPENRTRHSIPRLPSTPSKP